MTHRVRAALVVVLPILAACDIQVSDKGVSVEVVEGKASDTWSRTYALPPGGRLEIVNATGVIHAAPAGGPQVEVVATREINGRSTEQARALLQKIQMVEEVAPDRVRIETKGDWEGGEFSRYGVSIEYRVALPPGLHATFTSENGGVRLENVGGTIVANSTNGQINALRVSGALSATTVNGGIQVQFASIDGEVQLSTVNGPIRLDVPVGTDAVLEAKVVNGGITIDERLQLADANRTRSHVTGRLNQGGPRLVLQTTNGGIRVRAASPTGAAPED